MTASLAPKNIVTKSGLFLSTTSCIIGKAHLNSNKNLKNKRLITMILLNFRNLVLQPENPRFKISTRRNQQLDSEASHLKIDRLAYDFNKDVQKNTNP